MSRRPVESVLGRIEAACGRTPRVRLPDTGGEDPDLEAIALRQTGRYEVEGRVARGGVGVILKGRDTDLARNVALKVLRERHLGHVDLVRRLVEEARIGGQLQHPGMVPVYELGLLDENRPYFSMKLVKGRTLASCLADRKDPGEDRLRHLAIFDQVAATVAYAHSRGVIHRDLKPSNVMVGVFGEVLVVDWGFAKVLSRTDATKEATSNSESEGPETVPGAVMGTPAYMSPEQARGHVQDLDERSDVFSLGGILTEILTGVPLYTGDGSDMLERAARCETEGARARLDRCGADPELVAIAKRSLASRKEDRPRGAEVLSEAVGAHLARAEDRERRSTIASAEARREAAEERRRADEQKAVAAAAARLTAEQEARAERARRRTEHARAEADEARRARRHAIALGGALALVLLVVLGVYLLASTAARERTRETAEMVSAALNAAHRLRGDGMLVDAVAEARRADRIAGERDADPETRREVRTTVTRLEELHRRVVGERILDKRNRALLRSLAKIRAQWGPSFLPARLDTEFAAALRAQGLDLESGPEKEAAERILARGAAAGDLGAALDEWAWLRRVGGGRWRRVAAVADAADPDIPRRRIRAALESADPRTLRAIADGLSLETADPRTLSLLGFALVQARDPETAVELLRKAVFHHPGDAWVNLRLARTLESLSPPRTEAARRYYIVSYSLLPDVKHLLAEVDRTRAAPSALETFRKSIGWTDEIRFFTVEINVSAVTETRVRVRVEKEAVTQALLAWPSGTRHRTGEEPPLKYRAGTVFVAESLDQNGEVSATRTIRIREGREPDYLYFDDRGRLSPLFPQKDNPPGLSMRSNAPGACARCHEGSAGSQGAGVQPTVDFPNEPGPRRVLIEERYRDAAVVKRFNETRRCENRILGPYAAIWLTTLREGAREGTLHARDEEAYAALKRHYGELLGGD